MIVELLLRITEVVAVGVELLWLTEAVVVAVEMLLQLTLKTILETEQTVRTSLWGTQSSPQTRAAYEGPWLFPEAGLSPLTETKLVQE